MLAYKYHVNTAGVMVRRGEETVLIKDNERSLDAPYPIKHQQISLEDGWTGADWGDDEDSIWERFKEHGTPVPDAEMVKASCEAHARGDYLTTEELLNEIRNGPEE